LVLAKGHEKDARSRLGHEMRSFYHCGSEPVV
jgi:hypothetical protein